MIRTSDITSFTDHRQNLREHLNRVKETGRPLYITTNGETEAVVLSAKAFDEMAERVEFAETLDMLRRSEEDINAGRTMDALEAIRQIARKHGVKLNR